MFGLLKTAAKAGLLIAGTGLVLGLISRAEGGKKEEKPEASPQPETKQEEMPDIVQGDEPSATEDEAAQ